MTWGWPRLADTWRVPARTAAARHRKRLAGAMAVTIGVLAIELFAGIAGNSLALMADAGHVFADVSGMAVSLGAIWLANRPTSSGRSFGLYRLEIIAAVANALLLLGIAAFVLWESVRRLVTPPEIDSGLVIVVAAVALGANLVSLALLARGRGESLTMRAAYLEVAGDLLGAGAVLASGVVIAVTGFRAADAIASLLIGVLILPRTWSLLRDSVDVLLEATPKAVDLAEVRRHILEAPGVDAVHDLHVWTITSGMNVVSAHVVVRPDANAGAILDHLGMCLSDDFDVAHSTFQLETAEHVIWEGNAAQVQH
jgi:cobalt-zinc-cadmium efflux system protein